MLIMLTNCWHKKSLEEREVFWILVSFRLLIPNRSVYIINHTVKKGQIVFCRFWIKQKRKLFFKKHDSILTFGKHPYIYDSLSPHKAESEKAGAVMHICLHFQSVNNKDKWWTWLNLHTSFWTHLKHFLHE